MQPTATSAVGSPIYQHADCSSLYLFHDPNCHGGNSTPFGDIWVLRFGPISTSAFNDLDGDGLCNGLAWIRGDSSRPPMGSAFWQVTCEGTWRSQLVSVGEAPPPTPAPTSSRCERIREQFGDSLHDFATNVDSCADHHWFDPQFFECNDYPEGMRPSSDQSGCEEAPAETIMGMSRLHLSLAGAGTGLLALLGGVEVSRRCKKAADGKVAPAGTPDGAKEESSDDRVTPAGQPKNGPDEQEKGAAGAETGDLPKGPDMRAAKGSDMRAFSLAESRPTLLEDLRTTPARPKGTIEADLLRRTRCSDEEAGPPSSGALDAIRESTDSEEEDLTPAELEAAKVKCRESLSNILARRDPAALSRSPAARSAVSGAPWLLPGMLVD